LEVDTVNDDIEEVGINATGAADGKGADEKGAGG
jgi:hypothetical protein